MPVVIPFAHRSILAIRGPERHAFLQGLVTNDIMALHAETVLYSCLLTSNGRFLHDFLVFDHLDTLLLTPERARAADLQRLLRRYVLRRQIEIDCLDDWGVFGVCGDGVGAVTGFAADAAPGQAHPWGGGVCGLDPRHAALGAVVLLPPDSQALSHLQQGDFGVWDATRIRHGIPDGSRDIIPERGIPLENNIDRLHGISWTKGCYMGQELTARTHYRGLVRKGLVPVTGIPKDGIASDTPLFRNGTEAGFMRSAAGGIGLALLRLEDVATGDILTTATGATVVVSAVPPTAEPAPPLHPAN